MLNVLFAMFALIGCIIAIIGTGNAYIDKRPKGAFVLALSACVVLFIVCVKANING